MQSPSLNRSSFGTVVSLGSAANITPLSGEGPSLEKYKALLADEEGDAGEGEVDQEMEITWTTGLEDNQEVTVYLSV